MQKARKELEEKRRKEIDDDVTLTAEEKLRLKQLEEEEYTRTALDTLGLTSSASIDNFKPKTKEDFAELSEAICKKLSNYKENDEYVPFLDELVRSLLAGCELIKISKNIKCLFITFSVINAYEKDQDIRGQSHIGKVENGKGR